MHLRVWEFRPHPDRLAEFLAAYGTHGDWASLFARGDGFLGTELVRDTDDAGNYRTFDRWTSRATYDSFRARFAVEFAALDRACEALNERESFVGEFESASPAG